MKKKGFISGDKLAHRKDLRWKVCRVINDKFYSLLNVGTFYKPNKVDKWMREGLVLNYALGKKTVPTFGGIFGYQDLWSIYLEDICPCINGHTVVLAGRGARLRRKGLSLNGFERFKHWQGTEEELRGARLRFNCMNIRGLCYMAHFTPLWVCRLFPKMDRLDPSLLTFESS